MRKLIGILSLALSAGCGTVGAPQPPSLHLPEPVRDLRASRKGDKVTLAWTQPTETTDHEAVGKWLGETDICNLGFTTLGELLTGQGCGDTTSGRVQPRRQTGTAPVSVTFEIDLAKAFPTPFSRPPLRGIGF